MTHCQRRQLSTTRYAIRKHFRRCRTTISARKRRCHLQTVAQMHPVLSYSITNVRGRWRPLFHRCREPVNRYPNDRCHGSFDEQLYSLLKTLAIVAGAVIVAVQNREDVARKMSISDHLSLPHITMQVSSVDSSQATVKALSKVGNRINRLG